MASIFMDGFEINFAAGSAGIWDLKTANNGNIDYDSAFPRTGSGGLVAIGSVNSGYAYLSKTISSKTELYFGFSCQIPATRDTNAADGYVPIFVLRNSTVVQLMLCVHETTAYMAFLNGDNTVLGTSGEALTADAQHYIEGHVIINASTGAVGLDVDGVSKISLSSQDTHNSGNVDVVTVSLGCGFSGRGSNGTYYYDDFILNDTTGTTGTSWTNGARIEKLDPSADGNYSTWTSTGGAVDYTQIDDFASYATSNHDSDTTMLSSVTTDQRTSVLLDDTTVAGDVMAIQITSWVKGATPAVDQMAHFLRISATDYDQTAFAPTISYAFQHEILPLSPATSAAWTTAEIDAMELGFKRVT